MKTSRAKSYVVVTSGPWVLGQLLLEPASLRVRPVGPFVEHLTQLGVDLSARESKMSVGTIPAVLVSQAIAPWREAFLEALPQILDLEQLAERHQTEHAQRLEVAWALASRCVERFPAPEDPRYEGLYDFQNAGVSWLTKAGFRGILGDDMGLGKTVQALVVSAKVPGMRRLLIVGTSSTLRNWGREAAKWVPGISVRTCTTSAKTPKLVEQTLADPGQAALVLTWGLLASVQDDLARVPWDVVVADEAHYLKDPNSQRSRALLPLLLRAPSRILMTGTDMPNRTRELFPLLHAVDPVAWPSFIPFGEEYCGPRMTKIFGGGTIRTYDDSSHRQDLARKIRPYRIRRLKKDVLEALPEKILQTLPVDAPPALLKAYADWCLQIKLSSGQPSGEVLSGLSRLRLQTGLAKVEPAAEWISNAVSPTNPVVAFVALRQVHTELKARLEAEGHRVASIVGETPINRRQAIVDDFQAGRIDVLLGSTAMKEGVTLTRACTSIFVERWWTPGDESQAEDRTYRIGQDRGVLVVRMHLTGSTDDHVVSLMDRKASAIDALSGQGFIDLLLADLRSAHVPS